MRKHLLAVLCLGLLVSIVAYSQGIISGGGVSRIVAGTNITTSPASGIGSAVTINASGGATPAGSSGNIQYNNSGSFGGLATSGSGSTVPLTGGPTFTGKTIFASTQGTVTSDTDGATVTFDLAASNIHTVTLGGNRTLALSSATVGQVFTLILVQDGTGSRTVTWFSTIKWAGGSAPTLTTTLNKADMFTCMEYSSANYYCTVAGQSF